MASVKTVAVIGAGIMGRGIAHIAALGGYVSKFLPEPVKAALVKRAREGS